MTKVLNILLCTILINSCFIKNSFSYDEEDLQKLLKNNVCINCDLSGADFRKKNLSGANLEGSNLNKVNLWRANLKGANLKGCSIEEANLRRVNLENANLNNVSLRWSI
ncbi:MAG: pentapeptide repeat-containing protein, partial [Pelagibacterales bacterium]|nr:pentapeptide repeat-containing protein [Pelagibacterales bacterium]